MGSPLPFIIEAQLRSRAVRYRGTRVYKKIKNNINYFDSFGNLQPPRELVRYFGVGSTIRYNQDRFQDFDSVICGHLCLEFLTYKNNRAK